MVATLLGDLEPVEAQGPGGHRVDNLTIMFEPLAKLAPAEKAVFRIRAKGRRAGDQRIQVQLTSADQPAPITTEEITRVYADRSSGTATPRQSKRTREQEAQSRARWGHARGCPCSESRRWRQAKAGCRKRGRHRVSGGQDAEIPGIEVLCDAGPRRPHHDTLAARGPVRPVGCRRLSQSAVPGASTPRVRRRSEAVDVDHGQFVGRGFKDIAIVVSLHEFAPVGGWASRR